MPEQTTHLAGLISSVRVKPLGGEHAEVRVWVNGAYSGSLVMRTLEAEAFVAERQRAERQRAGRADAILDRFAAWLDGMSRTAVLPGDREVYAAVRDHLTDRREAPAGVAADV